MCGNKEVRALLRQNFGDQASAIAGNVQQVFGSLDADSDGVVTLAEFREKCEVGLREYYRVSDNRPWLLRDASLRGELKLAETSRAEKSGHKTPFLGTTALELRFRELYGIEAVCVPRYRQVLRTRCACGSASASAS